MLRAWHRSKIPSCTHYLIEDFGSLLDNAAFWVCLWHLSCFQELQHHLEIVEWLVDNSRWEDWQISDGNRKPCSHCSLSTKHYYNTTSVKASPSVESPKVLQLRSEECGSLHDPQHKPGFQTARPVAKSVCLSRLRPWVFYHFQSLDRILQVPIS